MIRWDVLIHICQSKQKKSFVSSFTPWMYFYVYYLWIYTTYLKKKCSKQYKTKTYTINLTHTKNAHNMRVAKPLFLRVRNSEEK